MNESHGVSTLIILLIKIKRTFEKI